MLEVLLSMSLDQAVSVRIQFIVIVIYKCLIALCQGTIVCFVFRQIKKSFRYLIFYFQAIAITVQWFGYSSYYQFKWIIVICYTLYEYLTISDCVIDFFSRFTMDIIKTPKVSSFYFSSLSSWLLLTLWYTEIIVNRCKFSYKYNL